MNNDTYSGFKGSAKIFLMNLVYLGVHKSFAKSLDIKKTDTLLDIGCGNGQLIHELCKYTNQTVSGLDPSESMIQASIKKNQQRILQKQVTIQQGSAVQLPYDNDCFNLVTAFETILFWPDIIDALFEAKRVLVPNGLMVVMNRLPKKKSKWYHWAQLKTPEDYLTAFQEAGFKDIHIDVTTKSGWIILRAR